MLKYQLHKLSKGVREARSVYLEDILTSDVFGMMYYMPYDKLLQPFLERIKIQNQQLELNVPKASPECFEFWKVYPWPDHLPYIKRVAIEPDVVIEWEELLIIVEAKFVSATDPEELLREYLVGCHEVASDRHFILLLIDRNLSMPQVLDSEKRKKVPIHSYLENRIRRLNLGKRFPAENVFKSFAWTNWQEVYLLIENGFPSASIEKAVNSKMNHRLFHDLLMVLKQKGLSPFEKLDIKEFQSYQVNPESLKGIGAMIQDPVFVLSNMFIDLDSLDQILIKKT